MWLNQSYYDQGKKTGKLKAWRIKKIDRQSYQFDSKLKRERL